MNAPDPRGANGASRPLPRHPRVWWSRMKARWPFLIWLAAAAAALWLFTTTGRLVPIQGMVDIIREDAAPLEDARLLAVHVKPGQPVRAGDKLATFDTALLEAEFEVERREIERDARRFYSDADQRVRDLEGALRDERLQESAARAELRAVETELKRLEDLVQQRLLDEPSVARYRVDRGRLANLAETHAANVRGLEQEVAKAVAARDALVGGGTNIVDGVDRLQRLYTLRREQYVLKAQQDGVVCSVTQCPGNVVGAGSPVVSITVNGSQSISGFVPEWSREDVRVGTPVRVARASSPGLLLPGRILAVNAEIAPLPISYAGSQLQNIRGRRIVVAVEQPADFVPGEGVMIYSGSPWWLRLLNRPDVVAEARPGVTPPGGS